MPRVSKGRITQKKVVIKDKRKCPLCRKEKVIENNFYKSANPLDAGYTSICKICINENVDSDDIESVKTMLTQLNKPLILNQWVSTCEEIERRGMSKQGTFGLYLKNLFINYKVLTWKDSDSMLEDEKIVSVNVEDKYTEVVHPVIHLGEDKNREDVLRMLGYDPFEFENPSDKRHLYNKLVDFLDESTLEDSFKLPAVIEIVKSFNQLDKINAAIASITQDSKKLAESVGSVKSLIDAKEKMLKNVLALAKDNGISVNHNNNKSKGAGTLSGIIKQLQDKGIESSEVNLYDVKTCEGMKIVSDISSKSIFEQLMLNENDYTDMIKDQRELIEKLNIKCEQLEEENRNLKLKIKKLESIELKIENEESVVAKYDNNY
jgi:hypothetical protein